MKDCNQVEPVLYQDEDIVFLNKIIAIVICMLVGIVLAGMLIAI